MKQFSLVFTLIDNFELEPKFKALYFIFTTIVYLNLTLAVVKQLFSLQILIPPFMFKTVLLEKKIKIQSLFWSVFPNFRTE